MRIKKTNMLSPIDPKEVKKEKQLHNKLTNDNLK